jgi:pSer/pThr/pTyr-binding forkhead associated (FHA) protein
MSFTLERSGSIGRGGDNDIVVGEGSVSREHALVNRIGNEYYLQDVGSKFGTYIEAGLPHSRALRDGDLLAFDDYYLEVLKVRVYRQKENDCFDLKARLVKHKETKVLSFYTQASLTIGRKDCDILFNYPAIEPRHARLAVEGGGLKLRREEGECFLRLEREELYLLEEEQVVRFGLQRVAVAKERKSRPWAGQPSSLLARK